MRTLAIVLALGGVAACNWTTFDDLANTTWVNSTQKPDQKSSDWGLAIQRGSMNGTPGRLAVLGTNSTVYTALSYGTDGKSELDAGVVDDQLNGEALLQDQPILLADPTTDNLSLVTPTQDSGAVAFTGTTSLQVVQFAAGTIPTGAAYMKLTNSPATDVLFVAIGDLVLPNIGCPSFMPPQLTLEDEVTSADNPVMVAAMAGVPISSPMHDDLVVWATNGKLYVYPDFDSAASPINDVSCPINLDQTLHAATVTDTGFMPGTGAQLLVDGKLVVVTGEKVGSSSGSNSPESLIVTYDVSTGTPTLVGAPIDRNDGVGLHAAVIQAYNGQSYVFAGFPTAPVNSLTTGVVEVFSYDGTNGIDPQPVQTLYDAQPDENELFGRSLAIMPYEGANVLAVGASNEVFAYFQIVDSGGSPIYEDPRTN